MRAPESARSIVERAVVLNGVIHRYARVFFLKCYKGKQRTGIVGAIRYPMTLNRGQILQGIRVCMRVRARSMTASQLNNGVHSIKMVVNNTMASRKKKIMKIQKNALYSRGEIFSQNEPVNFHILKYYPECVKSIENANF